jgi:hypothetical protein
MIERRVWLRTGHMPINRTFHPELKGSGVP